MMEIHFWTKDFDIDLDVFPFFESQVSCVAIILLPNHNFVVFERILSTPVSVTDIEIN